MLVHLDVTLQMPIEMYRVIYHHLGAIVKGSRAVHHHPSLCREQNLEPEIHGLLTLWGLRAWLLSQVRFIDFISHMFVAFLLVQHASHVKQFAASKCQAVLPQAALLVRHCSRLHCSPQRGRFPGETRLLWTLFHQGQRGRRRHRTGGSSKQGIAESPPPWKTATLRIEIEEMGKQDPMSVSSATIWYSSGHSFKNSWDFRFFIPFHPPNVVLIRPQMASQPGAPTGNTAIFYLGNPIPRADAKQNRLCRFGLSMGFLIPSPYY